MLPSTLLPLTVVIIALKAPILAFVLTREQPVPKSRLLSAILASQAAVLALWFFVVPMFRDGTSGFYLSTAMIVFVVEIVLLTLVTKGPGTQLVALAVVLGNAAVIGLDMALRYFAVGRIIAW